MEYKEAVDYLIKEYQEMVDYKGEDFYDLVYDKRLQFGVCLKLTFMNIVIETRREINNNGKAFVLENTHLFEGLNCHSFFYWFAETANEYECTLEKVKLSLSARLLVLKNI